MQVKCVAECRLNVLLKFPIEPVLAMKLLSWRCSAVQLYKVGSATVSLLSIVCFLLVCRGCSCRKDRKVMLHVGNSKHVHFSVRYLFPIPIKCCSYDVMNSSSYYVINLKMFTSQRVFYCGYVSLTTYSTLNLDDLLLYVFVYVSQLVRTSA